LDEKVRGEIQRFKLRSDLGRIDLVRITRSGTDPPDPRIAFATAASTDAEASGGYDAIFCMAVLRHSGLGLPGITRCDPLLRFQDFARAVADFDRCLKHGGLFGYSPQPFPPVRCAGRSAF
jgi:hypothetical protein